MISRSRCARSRRSRPAQSHRERAAQRAGSGLPAADRGAANRMHELIDDLLMFSRVSTRAQPFTAVNLSESVGNVLADLEVALEETGAQLTSRSCRRSRPSRCRCASCCRTCRQRAEVPSRRRPPGDHHPRDGRRRRRRADRRRQRAGHRRQFATRIFRTFERLHGSRAYQGTGVGLALCRKIVERHHGTITADGRENEGATFTVRLPLQAARVADAPPSSLFRPSPKRSHMHSPSP